MTRRLPSARTSSPRDNWRKRKSCHVGIAILAWARTGSDPAGQVFLKYGSRAPSDCGGRLFSGDWMSCSRQPGTKEAQGPELPYPAFNSSTERHTFKTTLTGLTRERQASTTAMVSTTLSNRSAGNNFRALSYSDSNPTTPSRASTATNNVPIGCGSRRRLRQLASYAACNGFASSA